MPPPPASRGRLISIIVICAVVAVGVIGFFMFGRSAPERTPSAAPPPAAATPAETPKSTVSETTVDLPSKAPPAQASLPPPSPSRQASGAPGNAPMRTPAATHGNLLIRSEPANADIIVNGTPRGKTPAALRDLPLGSYTIRLTHEGYAPDERSVELTSRRATAGVSFSLRPAAAERRAGTVTLNVQSRPAGANVFVNDHLAGVTPLAVPNVPGGPATVRIELEGYQPWVTTVDVGAADPTRVNASLERK